MPQPRTGVPSASGDAYRAARRNATRRRRKRRRVAFALVFAAALATLAGVVVPLLTTRTGAAPNRRASRRTTLPVTRPRRGRRVGSVPILMYHVINPPPRSAPFPGLYVPRSEFAAQMAALRAAGYDGVTLDQVESNWRNGTALPRGRPIVISFDNGYRSQYVNALPIIRRLGWHAVENLQLSGLPPSQGGLGAREVRGLVRAGWELDTQGFSHADLPTLAPAQLWHEIKAARTVIRRRYGVPVHWFCYPSGRYDARVVAAVKLAGYTGATTVEPGWAGASSDPYRLPRIRVLRGTSPASLLALVTGVRDNPPPPPAF